MKDTRICKALEALAGPLAETMGLTLWGVELTGGHGRGVVRLYLDSEEGVSVGQCADFSRDLSVALDVEDIVPGSYYLEVSSPGVDRPFFSLAQLRGFEGQELQVSLREAVDNRRKFAGKLLSVAEVDFVIEENGKTFTLVWDDVKKANLRYEFPAKGKKA